MIYLILLQFAIILLLTNRKNAHRLSHYKDRCYIAGRISGLDEIEVATNFSWAHARMCKDGYIVVNPLTLHDKKRSYFMYMVVDLWELIFCRSVYFQFNWKDSFGANIEHLFAVLLLKNRIYE